jgi:hypothetical protein
MKMRLMCLAAVLASACGGGTSTPDPAPSDPGRDLAADIADPGMPDPGGEQAADPGSLPDASPDPGRDAGTDPGVDPGSGPDHPIALPVACKTLEDCDDACGKAACTDGKCAYATRPGLCIVSNADSATCYGPGMSDPGLACLVCNPATSSARLTPVLLSEAFDSDAPAVSVQDLSDGGISWTLSDGRSHSGSKSLYFGDPSKKTYANGKHVSAAARFQGVAIPAGTAARLDFFLFLDTEETPGYDVLSVTATPVDDPQAETTVFQSDAIGGTTSGLFLPVSADLSTFAGRTVSLSFVFDSKDEGINSYEGAYLDDVRLVTGCCAVVEDCDDGNPCTGDTCLGIGKACDHVAKAGCCVTDADCKDEDSCTKDRCASPGGACVFDPIPGCCHDDSGCDDSDACTLDTCDVMTSACRHLPGCCKKDADCAPLDKCFSGTCTDGKCAYVDTCCHADLDCDDKDLCTTDKCKAGACSHSPAPVPGCCAVTQFDALFEGGEEGWVFSPEDNGVGWHAVSGGKSHGGSGALYYGNPDTKNFDSGGVNTGSAESPKFQLATDTGLELRFWVWLDTESGSGWDALSLSVVAGDQEIEVWSKDYGSPMNKWFEAKADLSSFAGREVSLRFFFDTNDDESNDGEGVYVDDLAITATCSPKTCATKSDCPTDDPCLAGVCIDGLCTWTNQCCASDDECDDGSVCTEDACGWSKKCTFTAIPGCCMGPGDCVDNDPCTEDLCAFAGALCEHLPIPNCCVKTKDCDDSDPCTKDLCTPDGCTHTDVCCASDAECDDGDDKCTVDKCVASFCRHDPTGAPGCCTSDLLATSFENGDAAGFELDPPVDGVGWTVTSAAKAAIGGWALYYGNPDTLDYDTGWDSNSGAALSPVVALPVGYGASLGFQVYMDTESDWEYDQLRVSWVSEAGTWTVWDKGDLDDFEAWVPVEVDLSAFAGTSGQVRFSFDTVDNLTNGTLGVLVDELAIRSSCAPVTCGTDSDCDDGLWFTNQSCSGGTCAYEVPEKIPECEDDWDCDDYDWCMIDSCVDQTCYNDWDPDCWWWD